MTKHALATLATIGIAIVASAIPATANAQQNLDESAPGYKGAQVRGATLSVGIQFGRLATDEPETGQPLNELFIDREGGGGTIAVGYTFSPRFNLRLAITAAAHETAPIALDVVYGTGMLEAQYRFASASVARPYLMGGLGGAALRIMDDNDNAIELSGPGARIGGGLHVNLSRQFVLDIGAAMDFLNPEEQTIELSDGSGGTVEASSPVEGKEYAGRVSLAIEFGF